MSGAEGAVISVEGLYLSAWKEAFVNILAGLLLSFLEFERRLVSRENLLGWNACVMHRTLLGISGRLCRCCVYILNLGVLCALTVGV